MDNLKVSSQQFNREVNSSQRVEKQRDESFIASSLVENKDKNNENAVKNADLHANSRQTVPDDRSTVLLEQRKQEMAERLSDKEKTNQQLEKSQELSLQRRIEERSAANRQKLKGSYAAVQQSDIEQQVQETDAEQNTEPRMDKHHAQDAINLVV